MSGEVVGIVPAAGLAVRLDSIPCSKEIFPIGYLREGDAPPRPVAACEYLLWKYRAADARRVFVVLREGKWDIPAYLGDGHRIGLDLAYLIARVTFGQPFTIDAAYPFVRGATVLLGCPDILFDRTDAFVHLLQRKAASGADVVLGIFPARRPEKMDMIELDENGKIMGFVIKPQQTQLTHTWLVAAWSARFTQFLHEDVGRRLREGDVRHPSGRELYLGDVFHSAVCEGLAFDTVVYGDTDFIDIGTPEDLAEAARREVGESFAGRAVSPRR